MRKDKAISHCNQGRLLQEEFEDTKGVIKIEGQTFYIIVLFFTSDMYKFEMLRIWTLFITRTLLYQEFPIG
jgi:hypothetical protein